MPSDPITPDPDPVEPDPAPVAPDPTPDPAPDVPDDPPLDGSVPNEVSTEPVTAAILTDSLNALAMAMVGSPHNVTATNITDLVAANLPDAVPDDDGGV